MTDAGLIQRRNGPLCDKILRRHQDRLAIVFVRQSTVQQVERHQESTKLQYALADRASQFGWAREQIIVIDDDLGRSGASIEGRWAFSGWSPRSASVRSVSCSASRCRDWRAPAGIGISFWRYARCSTR
jgi:hypothetical protein